MNILKIESLNVAYGHAQVLHNISLAIDEGEMVCVVGRNGAGKTTLLRTISGFLKPVSGMIQIFNRDVKGLPPEKLALMGIRYVYQDKRVFTKLSVRENIELAAYPTGEDVNSALDRVVSIYPKITQFFDKKAGGLSGGQRQLLLLGRALIGNPKLLLIDEPTEGIAAGVIEDICVVLENMKGQLTCIIVEQNLAVVSRLADRVYIMKEGQIPAELRTTSEIQDFQCMESFL